MPQFIISTVGTSLLTNQIDPDIDPRNWLDRLNEAANYTVEEMEYYPDVKDILETLKQRVEEKLYNEDTEDDEIREISAELNGIYGIYEYTEKNPQDQHWLIQTDTAQGEIAANIVQKFLESKGMAVQVYSPDNLSTRSTEKFQDGIDKFLEWADQTLRKYKYDGYYKIRFNLVGGFKALQGYLNTIGMFYADEIIYIFEGSSELVKIPRLPIEIKKSVIKPVQFALMATEVGIWVKRSELEGVEPAETLLFIVDDEATLTNWGRLTWNNCKRDFLTTEKLLEFPKIKYEQSFSKDYQKNATDDQKKLDLHEVIAEVSASILKYNGDTTRFDRRLNFSRYEGKKKCEGGISKNQIDHFYIKNTGRRVSCILDKGQLYLRHYGEHDYVNDNP
ncbi:MAG: putative CRISPR-associated protein [Limnoraphis sp. WC205]|jgi:putative CRISPR-associated protein (TIGR02619 family)|nr:putative CRISPR-associated protein [Limnoraphis sp. WC205]